VAWLRVCRPGAVLDVGAPDPAPDELILRARVVGTLGAPGALGVAAWTFGFRYGATFVGVVLDATGRVAERHGVVPPPVPTFGGPA